MYFWLVRSRVEGGNNVWCCILRSGSFVQNGINSYVSPTMVVVMMMDGLDTYVRSVAGQPASQSVTVLPPSYHIERAGRQAGGENEPWGGRIWMEIDEDIIVAVQRVW